MNRDQVVEMIANKLLLNADVSHISGLIDEGDGLIVVMMEDGTWWNVNVTFNNGGTSNDN